MLLKQYFCIQNLSYFFFQILKCISSSRSTDTPYTDIVKSKKTPKDDHVKRPLNCFMLYSKIVRPKIRKDNPGKTQNEISSILGKQWKTLSPSEKEKYKDGSMALKKIHSVQYPSYIFQPKRKTHTSALRVKYASKRATKKVQKKPLQEPLQSEQLEPEPTQNELSQLEPKEQFQQEQTQPEPLQQDIQVEQKEVKQFEEFESQTSHCGPPLYREPLQTKPIQRKVSRRPSIEPLLGQTSNSILPHYRLPFSKDEDEDDKMMQLVDMNVVLELQFQESSPVSLDQHLY